MKWMLIMAAFVAALVCTGTCVVMAAEFVATPAPDWATALGNDVQELRKDVKKLEKVVEDLRANAVCPECLAAGIGPDGRPLRPGRNAMPGCAGCPNCPGGVCTVPGQCGTPACMGGNCGQGMSMMMRSNCGQMMMSGDGCGAGQGRRRIFPLFRRGGGGGSCTSGSCGS